ncbi:hypothetical protein [Carboxylicivirga marina]|uniref:YcxB-like protein domain-containing protein n=1 Tax=Carboxylicivirga marina TaxID=2800988 RepID=A0ABS1HQH8_9BACT|nr:hypothetical protein [Carboxylicivirga marina]MBK3519424.1 hypothetical protein [Carboxylicivirga marina]
MIESNVLGKTFGPVGSFTGIVLFCFGLYSVVIGALGGIVLIITGAFIAFTRPYTSINYEQKKVRSGDKIFGFLKTGKWKDITGDMKVGLWSSSKTYRTYSRSNRSLDITEKRQIICLFNAQGKKLMMLKSVQKDEDMHEELETISANLGLEILQ